jgi:hypothetical protein
MVLIAADADAELMKPEEMSSRVCGQWLPQHVWWVTIRTAAAMGGERLFSVEWVWTVNDRQNGFAVYFEKHCLVVAFHTDFYIVRLEVNLKQQGSFPLWDSVLPHKLDRVLDESQELLDLWVVWREVSFSSLQRSQLASLAPVFR